MPALPPLPRPQPASADLQPALHALRAHYREMPGLSLTASQARRLCGLLDFDLPACEAFLERLVSEGFLRRLPDGRYRRAA